MNRLPFTPPQIHEEALGRFPAPHREAVAAQANDPLTWARAYARTLLYQKGWGIQYGGIYAEIAVAHALLSGDQPVGIPELGRSPLISDWTQAQFYNYRDQFKKAIRGEHRKGGLLRRNSDLVRGDVEAGITLDDDVLAQQLVSRQRALAWLLEMLNSHNTTSLQGDLRPKDLVFSDGRYPLSRLGEHAAFDEPTSLVDLFQPSAEDQALTLYTPPAHYEEALQRVETLKSKLNIKAEAQCTLLALLTMQPHGTEVLRPTLTRHLTLIHAQGRTSLNDVAFARAVYDFLIKCKSGKSLSGLVQVRFDTSKQKTVIACRLNPYAWTRLLQLQAHIEADKEDEEDPEDKGKKPKPLSPKLLQHAAILKGFRRDGVYRIDPSKQFLPSNAVEELIDKDLMVIQLDGEVSRPHNSDKMANFPAEELYQHLTPGFVIVWDFNENNISVVHHQFLEEIPTSALALGSPGSQGRS